MRLWSPRSLRQKLLGLVLLTTLVALVVALGALIGYDLRAYHRTLVSDMTTQAELLGRTIAPALAFDDPRVAKENLGLLRFRPLVSSAAVYNARGALFVTYARTDDKHAFPKLPGPEGARVEDGDLVLFKRIVNDNEILGTVYLRADYELFGRVFDYLGIAAVVLIAATRPVLAIAEIAREVVERRDYSRRAVKMSADEVGTLVEAFNDMLAEIERRTLELEASNAKLGREVEERSRAEREVLRLNAELEDRVRERTAQLETANKELEAFSYSVSHDLRAPLRAIDGFGQALVDDFPQHLPEAARRYLTRIRGSTQYMAQLIEDLLNLARVSRGKLECRPVDLSQLARAVAGELQQRESGRSVEISVWDGMSAEQRLEVHLEVRETPHRNRRLERSRAHHLLCARQRGGLRHGLRRQAFRRVSAPARRKGLRRHRDRACDRSAHRAPAWRAHLGRGRGGQGRGVLFYAGIRGGGDRRGPADRGKSPWIRRRSRCCSSRTPKSTSSSRCARSIRAGSTSRGNASRSRRS
ncbi:MAG: hypothetical protein E6H75_04435 [Betaproteobacteria bacterium]|nr:MAG: hypothetical protein E6H75_04435 [Betaproteobacteria bacterium]